MFPCNAARNDSPGSDSTNSSHLSTAMRSSDASWARAVETSGSPKSRIERSQGMSKVFQSRNKSIQNPETCSLKGLPKTNLENVSYRKTDDQRFKKSDARLTLSAPNPSPVKRMWLACKCVIGRKRSRSRNTVSILPRTKPVFLQSERAKGKFCCP